MVLEQFIAKDAFRNIKVSSSVLLSCIWAALKGKPDIQHIGLGLFLIGGFHLQTTNHRRLHYVSWLRLSGASESFLRAQASTKWARHASYLIHQGLCRLQASNWGTCAGHWHQETKHGSNMVPKKLKIIFKNILNTKLKNIELST